MSSNEGESDPARPLRLTQPLSYFVTQPCLGSYDERTRTARTVHATVLYHMLQCVFNTVFGPSRATFDVPVYSSTYTQTELQGEPGEP